MLEYMLNQELYLPVAELQARQHLQDVLIEEEPFTFHCSGATIHVTDFKDLVVIGDNPCEISPDIEDRRQNDQTVIVLDDSHTFPRPLKPDTLLQSNHIYLHPAPTAPA